MSTSKALRCRLPPHFYSEQIETHALIYLSCVGYKINIHKRYVRRNPDAAKPASNFQSTRYLRGGLKFTYNFNGKFHFLENQLDICLEVSNDFKHDLGIESPWGELPIMGSQGEAPPERGTFSGFRYMKG